MTRDEAESFWEDVRRDRIAELKKEKNEQRDRIVLDRNTGDDERDADRPDLSNHQTE